MKISELENLFQDLTCSILNLDKDRQVRISWPTEGAPAWSITDDVLFIRVVPVDNMYNRQRERRYYYQANPEGLIKEVSYTRVSSIVWIAYGPGSFEHLQNLRDGLFDDVIRSILAKQNLYMVPDIVEPLRVPELFSGRWWERVDMGITFYEFIKRHVLEPFVKYVDVYVEGGLEVSVEGSDFQRKVEIGLGRIQQEESVKVEEFLDILYK